MPGSSGFSSSLSTARALRETAGPTLLVIGALTDGQFLKRVGATLVSAALSGIANLVDSGANVVPTADSVCAIGTSSLRLVSVNATAHNVHTTLGDSNPTASLGGAKVTFGAGGGSSPDLKIERSAAKTLTIDDNAGGALTSVVFNSAAVLQGSLPVRPIAVRKSADESITSNTTPQDDDHLSMPLGASEEWIGEAFLSFGDACNTTGIKVVLSTAAGSSVEVFAVLGQDTATLNKSFRITAVDGVNDIVAATFGPGSKGILMIHFWVLNGATPGVIKIQWSQSTSSGTALVMRKGSYLRAQRVA